jgi:hypothetical protein
MKLFDIAHKGNTIYLAITLDNGDIGRVDLRKPSIGRAATFAPHSVYDARDRQATDVLAEKVVKQFGSSSVIHAFDNLQNMKELIQKGLGVPNGADTGGSKASGQ